MEAFDHRTVDAISSSGNSQCRSFDHEEKEALGFGCWLFDASPIFIAKDASSSNEMSTNLFQDWCFLNSNSATS
jgi:hypothetical protein